jgi:hypothetical protein
MEFVRVEGAPGQWARAPSDAQEETDGWRAGPAYQGGCARGGMERGLCDVFPKWAEKAGDAAQVGFCSFLFYSLFPFLYFQV